MSDEGFSDLLLPSQLVQNMNKLQYLIDIGFVNVGKWKMEADGINYEIKSDVHNKKWVLYAFSSDDEVLYIGKSTIAFHKRMYGYKRPAASQKTNIKNNAFIADMIRASKGVDIYLFEGEKKLEYKGISINLAAGLEDPLIGKLTPRWNQTGQIQGA